MLGVPRRLRRLASVHDAAFVEAQPLIARLLKPPEAAITGSKMQAPYPRRAIMSALFDELSKRSRELAIEERAQLAQVLLESVDQEAVPEVQSAWETEIASRLAKYERGEARLIPATEVFEAARRLTQ